MNKTFPFPVTVPVFQSPEVFPNIWHSHFMIVIITTNVIDCTITSLWLQVAFLCWLWTWGSHPFACGPCTGLMWMDNEFVECLFKSSARFFELLLCLRCSLYNSRSRSFVRYLTCKYFLPIQGLPLVFLAVVFQKVLILLKIIYSLKILLCYLIFVIFKMFSTFSE